MALIYNALHLIQAAFWIDLDRGGGLKRLLDLIGRKSIMSGMDREMGELWTRTTVAF
jgi:hypothetical protein